MDSCLISKYPYTYGSTDADISMDCALMGNDMERVMLFGMIASTIVSEGDNVIYHQIMSADPQKEAQEQVLKSRKFSANTQIATCEKDTQASSNSVAIVTKKPVLIVHL